MDQAFDDLLKALKEKHQALEPNVRAEIDNDWDPIIRFLQGNDELYIDDHLKAKAQTVKRFSNNKNFKKKINIIDKTIKNWVSKGNSFVVTPYPSGNEMGGGRRRRSHRRRATLRRVRRSRAPKTRRRSVRRRR